MYKSFFSRLMKQIQRKCHESSFTIRTNSQLNSSANEVKIPVPWGHIAGKWWGNKNVQPVIGIHGWQDNAGSFDKLVPLLNVNSFLAIDLPGHGFSSHFPSGKVYSFIDFVIVLRLVAKYFGWTDLSMMGHSFGSVMIFVYAALFPKDVQKYVGIDCARTVLAHKSISNFHYYKMTDYLISIENKMNFNEPPTYTYEEIVSLLQTGSKNSLSNESCEVLLHRGMVRSLRDKRCYFSRDPRVRHYAWNRITYEHVLKFSTHIICDVLYIRAKQGFNYGDVHEDVYNESIQLMKNSSKRVEHCDIEGTHHIHLNNPMCVATIINRFFGTV